MADTILKLKSVFRENVKKQRAKVTPQEAQEASLSLWLQLKEDVIFQKAERIAAFCSAGTEIDVTPLLSGILKSGKELYLPKTDQTKTVMEFHSISNLKKLIPGPLDILEPPDGKTIAPKHIDLILVPGLAFDNRGNRLGYGHGYYDRYLKLVDPKCFILGVAYSFQIIDKTPKTNHDIPVHAVLTEKYILLC